MKEQNEQKEKDKKTKKNWFKGEKRFYLLTAIGCALALTAIIVVAVAIGGDKTSEPQVDGGNNGDNVAVLPPEDDEQQVGGNENEGNDEQQQPVVKPDEGMVSPIQSMNVVNEYGFYHNVTLNWFYEHEGVDFAAEAGTEVVAVEAGTIESIYEDDILCGTEITVDHGDGLKTIYRFVTEIEGLKVGDSVEKGEVIATVAEANGNEYKDGAHLHFEVHKDGVNVDPNVYLTLEEK